MITIIAISYSQDLVLTVRQGFLIYIVKFPTNFMADDDPDLEKLVKDLHLSLIHAGSTTTTLQASSSESWRYSFYGKNYVVIVLLCLKP